MAKYAVNSNNSDAANKEGQDEESDSPKSVRAECDSQIESDAADDDFCVDGSRPCFQEPLSDSLRSDQIKNLAASKLGHSDYA